MMRHDASTFRYLPAHHVAHGAISLGGFDVRDIAGDTLGILDGFLVDSSARRVSHVVVEGRGWATRRRYLIPIGQALMNAEARTLQLEVRGYKNCQTVEPDDFPVFSVDDLAAYSDSANAA